MSIVDSTGNQDEYVVSIQSEINNFIKVLNEVVS